MRLILLTILLITSVSYAHAAPRIMTPGAQWDIPEWWDETAEWYAIVPGTEEEAEQLNANSHYPLAPYKVVRAPLSMRKIPEEDVQQRDFTLEGEIENAIFYVSGLPVKDGQRIASPEPSYYKTNKDLRIGYPMHLRTEAGVLHINPSGDYRWDKKADTEVLEKYMLFVQWNKNDQQKIMEASEFDDEIPNIIWNGDLNNDGVTDMLLDVSTKYSAMHFELWLSEKSDDKVSFYHACSYKDYSC